MSTLHQVGSLRYCASLISILFGNGIAIYNLDSIQSYGFTMFWLFDVFSYGDFKKENTQKRKFRIEKSMKPINLGLFLAKTFQKCSENSLKGECFSSAQWISSLFSWLAEHNEETFCDIISNSDLHIKPGKKRLEYQRKLWWWIGHSLRSSYVP